MLKGKQGRFRQNLLGKRVDYSGRSVIVVGPELKLHQCGLPKKMALELFKPFVMRQLVEKGFAHNIKSAKRIVERVRPEVWDVLEEVIKDHPVLLNRAPTLHRLGIQAFMPVLVEGSAIQIHPLVCFAFNADFDGDQMAVHVPLSRAAQEEAKRMMLSTANLLSPSDGGPVVAPTQDMILGCYYLTLEREDKANDPVTAFADEQEALLAYEIGRIDTRTTIDDLPNHRVRKLELHSPIQLPVRMWDKETEEVVEREVRTTVGRLIFNQILPERLRFANRPMNRAALREIVSDCYRLLGSVETAHLVDGIKSVGFKYATRGGMTIAVSDIPVSENKDALLVLADQEVATIDQQFQRGLITEDERYEKVVEVWKDTTAKVVETMRVRPVTERGESRLVLLADLGGHDDRLRCPREQGQHRTAGRHARPDDRPDRPDHRRAGALELPRGHDRPRVLHLHPRRPQGPRGHRPPHRGLRVPDPASRGRGPGRHHP